MKIFRDFNINSNLSSVVTIGNFDGLHLGHKRLIETTKKLSMEHGYNSIVLTFTPHPMQIIKNKIFPCIVSEYEKDMEMKNEDVDFFIKCPFTVEFSNTTPLEFIDILSNKLNCKILIVGEDYCFGKNKSGNVGTLESICSSRIIQFKKMKHILQNNEKISSTNIRKAILDKNIKLANSMLGKKYHLLGEVCSGNMLGRTIGFPTANLEPPVNKILPPDGVYITQTIYNNKTYNSITNIGKNPTVDNMKRTVETFIFDFNEDIYGKEIKVLFDGFIRDVRKFNDLDELKEQISKDREVAKSRRT